MKRSWSWTRPPDRTACSKRAFLRKTDITGIVLIQARRHRQGSVIIGIQTGLGLPVKYIGIGEEIEDLQPFDQPVVQALFEN
jgi:fused signal recognition particle receptor